MSTPHILVRKLGYANLEAVVDSRSNASEERVPKEDRA